MQLKKNWFSFLIWVLVSVASGTFLAVQVIYSAVTLGFVNNDTLIGFVVLAFIFCFAAYELVSTVISRFHNTRRISEERKKKAFQIIFVLTYIFFMVYRFAILSTNHFSLGNQDVIYYAAANTRMSAAPDASLLKQVYIYLFRFLFRFLGTSPVVAVIFQYFLEQVSLFLAYWILKTIGNDGMAAFFFFIICCAQGFHMDKHILTEESLFLLFSLLLILMFLTVNDYAKTHYRLGISTEILYAVCGILSGILAAMYVYGWVFILAFFITTLSETVMDVIKDEQAQSVSHYMPSYAAYLLIGAIISFLLTVFLSFGTGHAIGDAMSHYFDLYFSNIHFEYKWIYMADYPLMNLISAILITFWFFVYLVVPYDFARLQALIWIAFRGMQLLGVPMEHFYVTTPIVNTFAATAGFIGIVYYHENRLRFQKENREISFQTDRDLDEMKGKGLDEPPAGERGEEDWNQVFADGRDGNEGMILEKSNLLQEMKAISNVSMRQNAVEEQEEEKQWIHPSVSVQEPSFLSEEIEYPSYGFSTEETTISEEDYVQDDSGNVVSEPVAKPLQPTLVEPVTPKPVKYIKEPIKQPEKKNKPKLDFEINVNFTKELFDFDLLDIPDDDDFDIE